MNRHLDQSSGEQRQPTKLDDLARLTRKARYIALQRQTQSRELWRAQVGNELLIRLSWTMRDSFSTLVELARGDSAMVRRDFIEVYGEVMQMADSIFEHVDAKEETTPAGFAQHLSLQAGDCILRLLQRIRTDHDWVASRLSRLSATKLEALVPPSEASLKQSSSLRETTTDRSNVQDLRRTDVVFSLVISVWAPLGNIQAEDLSRLQLSAAILHRLIQESKLSSKTDKLCLSFMDTWTTLYGWGGLKHFEVLLLDIMQSGHKIIERAEARVLSTHSQNRGYYFSHQQKDEIEEEFFTDAARRIFKLLDSDALEGLPGGALRLAHAVLAKVDEHESRHYEAFITINWFFYRFLARVIISPEEFGILNDYNINEIKRTRILGPLKTKVLACCVPTNKHNNINKKRSTAEEEIEEHVVSIFSKFRAPTTTPDLQSLNYLSSDSYLSNSVSAQVQASFQACPTMISALFTTLCTEYDNIQQTKDRSIIRQHSSSSAASEKSLGTRSCQSPNVAFSIGSFVHHSDVFDHSPVQEKSDTRKGRPSIHYPDALRLEADHICEPYKAMYFALKEFQTSSSEISARSEPWQRIAVLQDELSYGNDEEDAAPFSSPDDSDTIKTAVYNLVKSFQIHSITSSRKEFINSRQTRSHLSSSAGYFCNNTKEPGRESDLLQTMLRAGQICLQQRNYSLSDIYYKAYNLLHKKLRTPEAVEDFSPLLHGYCMEQDELIENHERAIEYKEVLMILALDRKASLMQHVDEQILRLNKVRLRMWYLCDVRNSKAWDRSWEVVKCLIRMKNITTTGSSGKNWQHKEASNGYHFQSASSSGMVRTTSRDRRFVKPSRTSSHIHESHATGVVDAKIFEALVGSNGVISSNKLGSEQTRQTADWMRETDIHNFCVAEERLQRLCYEVDDLARYFMRIDMDSVDTMDIEEAVASKLWKFDLFQYECTIFKITVRSRDRMSADLRTTQSEDAGISGLLRRGSAGDLLNLARGGGRVRGNSVGSLDHPQSRILNRNSSGLTSFSDLYADNKSQSSPVRSIDTSRRLFMTSTDPFTLDVPKQYDEQGVKDFLLRSQVGLISLLLSDFADLIFGRGSETDEWYNDDITEMILAKAKGEHKDVFIETREEDDDHFSVPPVRKVAITEPIKPLLRHNRTRSSNMSHFFGGSIYMPSDLKAPLAAPSIDISHSIDKTGVAMERASSSGSYLDVSNTSDSLTTPHTPMRSFNPHSHQPQQFPLQRAYKEIMHRFSVQTSPYEKLRALYELELLVVSNLTRQVDIEELGLHKLAPVMPITPIVVPPKSGLSASPSTSRTHFQRDSVDLSKLRVEELSIRSIPTTPLRSSVYTTESTESNGTSGSAPGADTIVAEIQQILRNSDLRPKTLFRDLQYIATFIPASILNMTDEGKVFWDFSLAALAVKREAVDLVVVHALKFLEETSTNLHTMLPPSLLPDGSKSLSSFADIVTMLTYAAKEQNPAAMRELGLLMYNKPEHCELVLPPYSDPAKVLGRQKSSSTSAARMLDSTMKSLAGQAWIERAASEGDVKAQEWLRDQQ